MADPPTETTDTPPALADTKEINRAKKAAAKAERAAKREVEKAERAAQKAEAKEKKKKQVKSLAKMAEAKILKDLGASLETHARSATFACGGSVSFKTATEETAKDASDDGAQQERVNEGQNVAEGEPTPSTIDDVQVRFGPSGTGFTVVFGQRGPSSNKDFEHLLKTCQPASFGRGGEAVHDEEYRKAGKLDTSQFATSFCPYEAGIIDVVTQLLVPHCKHGKHSRSIKAELYKLNIYSAPNGKFKPHVDTPRSENQIGSLVVSLPSSHEGGQLTVNNGGAADQSVVFDWSNADEEESGDVKWAAFYSDCEHEVHEVTSGHRITLTYNLFLTRGAGHLAGAPSALDSTQLPLYEGLQSALDNPGFFRRGRVLAMYLNHCYAHTSAHVNFLPDSLKGADMSLWNTAKALGLKCQVVPIMTLPYNYEHDGDIHLYEPKFHRFNGGSYGGFQVGECEEWGYEMPETKVSWLNSSGQPSKKRSKAESKEKSEKAKPDFEEVQMAYLAYGNEPNIDIHYTRAAMLIRIPPYHERDADKAEPKSIWDGIKLDPSEYEDWGDDSDEFSYSSSDGMEDDEDDEDDEDEDEDDDEDEGDEVEAEDEQGGEERSKVDA